jgi:hypothetical protein
MKNFVLDCIQGDALIDDLDRYVDYWHENSQELNCDLRNFLGMSLSEYNYFLKDEDYIADIIYAHEHNLDIEEVLEFNANNVPMAARADKADEMKVIQDWLKNVKDE